MRGGRKEPEQRQGRKEHSVGGSKQPVSMERTPFGLGDGGKDAVAPVQLQRRLDGPTW